MGHREQILLTDCDGRGEVRLSYDLYPAVRAPFNDP